MADEKTREQEFIDAGFTVERIGSVTVYSRPVPDFIIEMCKRFAYKEVGRTQAARPDLNKNDAC